MKRFLIVILLTALLPDVSIWTLYLREVPLLVSILWFLPTTLLTAAWLALVFEFRHSLAARTLNGCILCFVVPKICFLLFQIITPWAGLLAAVTAELLAIYGLTLGWRRLKVRQVKICFPTLPAAFDGYRLLHLSDFHLGTFGRHNPFVRRVIETANQQESAWEGLAVVLYYFSFIAINLGVMNLLPIPALDGGRIVGLLLTTLIERITRKKLNPKYEAWINGVGMVLLLLLIAVITFKDIFHLFT